jgi:hypothetical protein
MPCRRSRLVHVVLVSAITGVAAFTATLVAVAPIAAQTHPDFSGTWTLVTPGWRSWSSMGVTFSAAQDADTLTVTYLVFDPSSGPVQVRRTFSLTASARGSDHWPAIARVTDSVSTAAWRGTSLVIQSTVTPAPEPGARFTRSKPPVTSTDVWSLNADGTLAIDSTGPVAGPQTAHSAFKSVFKKVAADDLVRAPIESAPTAVSPAADGMWLGGYRFGMTVDEARRVTTCPGRNYHQSLGPGLLVLLCYEFPFEGMKLRMLARFEPDVLTSIDLEQGPESEAAAHKATDTILAYLQRDVGPPSSLELPFEPLTTDAIWRNVKAQPRDRGPTVRVLTPHRYASAVITAGFAGSGTDYSVWVGISAPRPPG